MKEKNKDYVIGLRAVMECIESGKNINKIFIKKGLKGDLIQECMQHIRKHKIPFQYVPSEKLNGITRANHQGMIALISPIPFYDITHIIPSLYEEGLEPFILLLDGITDVRNFGAIARTAEAAGVHAIVIGTKKAATINFEAIKTSAGALNRIKVCRSEKLADTLNFLSQSGLKIYGASEKANSDYIQPEYSGPKTLVMGAEDVGISEPCLLKIDELIKIPMNGTIASLNVGVACGIILFKMIQVK